MKKQWTTRGRVVYDRKKNLFKLRDFLRIGKKVGSYTVVVTPNLYSRILKDIIDSGKAVEGSVQTLPEFEFGGGSFGGAGASREFGETSQWLVLTIITKVTEVT